MTKTKVVAIMLLLLALATCAALLLIFGAHSSSSTGGNRHESKSPSRRLAPPEGYEGVTLIIHQYSPPWTDDGKTYASPKESSLATPEDAERSFSSADAAGSKEWIKKCVTAETFDILSKGPELRLETPHPELEKPAVPRYYYKVSIEEPGGDKYSVLYFKLLGTNDTEAKQGYSVFAYKKESDGWKRCFEFQRKPLYELLSREDPAILFEEGRAIAGRQDGN